MSAKGSPGVTTLAVAMACACGRVLVEMDPAGGDFALRAAVPQSPGLSELAVRARRARGTAISLDGCAQRLRSGAVVVAAPVGMSGASGLLTASGPLEELAAALSCADTQVLIDAGRFGPHIAAFDACGALRIVVARRDAASLGQAQALLRELQGHYDRPRVGLVLVDRGQFGAGEVARELGAPLLGTVPWNERDAEKVTSCATAQTTRNNRIVHAAASIVNGAEVLAGLGGQMTTRGSSPLGAWLSHAEVPA